MVMSAIVIRRFVLMLLIVGTVCQKSTIGASVVRPANNQTTQKSDETNQLIAAEQQKRPFYNIAHMANSIARTRASLRRGANAIEVDVTFHPHDITLYHGFPCDCFRFCWHWESLDTYLHFARRATTPDTADYDPRFVLLYFDVKLDGFTPEQKYEQGVRFATHLAVHFFVRPLRTRLKLVVSVMWAKDEEFLRGLIQELKQLKLFDEIGDQIGFDVGQDYDMASIETMWSRLNVSNVWQGEGITNCVSHFFNQRPAHLTKRRDRHQETYFHKVYSWTVDRTESIKSALTLGIDGLMTNQPDRINRILTEPGFSQSFRLATVDDNPFRKVPFTQPLGKERTPRSLTARAALLMRDVTESAYFFIVEVLQTLGFVA